MAAGGRAPSALVALGAICVALGCAAAGPVNVSALAPHAAPPLGSSPALVGASTPVSTDVIGVTATMSVGLFPTSMAQDLANGWMYVTNKGSGTVSILDGTMVLMNVSVGTGDAGIAYDPVTETMYIADSGSDQVTVINGTQVIATIPVGDSPEAPAYDPADGYVYVPNFHSSSVTILNNTTVVGTTPVGLEPVDATYDPVSGTVYVTNEESEFENILAGNTTVGVALTRLVAPFSTIFDPVNGLLYVTNVTPNGGIESDVTILNGSSILSTFPVGPGPGYAAVNSLTGKVYLPISGDDEVQLIQNTSTAGIVDVGGDPNSAAFDPSNGLVYISDELTDDVIVINGSKPVADVTVGTNPTIAAYDSANGLVYATVWGNEEMVALGLVPGWSVNFTESGLPKGTDWSITTKQVTMTSHDPSIVEYESNGSYEFVVGSVAGYVANPANGSFQVQGNPNEIAIDFHTAPVPAGPGLFGLPNPAGAVLLGLGIAIVAGVIVWQLLVRRARRRERVLRVAEGEPKRPGSAPVMLRSVFARPRLPG
ncbi:MAG: YncE family protein [Thermoplasmata archaeon]